MDENTEQERDPRSIREQAEAIVAEANEIEPDRQFRLVGNRVVPVRKRGSRANN